MDNNMRKGLCINTLKAAAGSRTGCEREHRAAV